MMVGQRIFGAALALGAVGGGIATVASGWRAPIRPVTSSIDVAFNPILLSAPGALLAYASTPLAARGGALGAVGGALQLVGVTAVGLGLAAGTVGYFNWFRQNGETATPK